MKFILDNLLDLMAVLGGLLTSVAVGLFDVRLGLLTLGVLLMVAAVYGARVNAGAKP